MPVAAGVAGPVVDWVETWDHATPGSPTAAIAGALQSRRLARCPVLFSYVFTLSPIPRCSALGGLYEATAPAKTPSGRDQHDGRCRLFFFSSRRRHTIWTGDWSSDVCSSD